MSMQRTPKYYATTNIFKLVDNGRIFEYTVLEGLEALRAAQEGDIFAAIENAYPRAFLSKMIDVQAGLFFSISFKATFEFRLSHGEEEV